MDFAKEAIALGSKIVVFIRNHQWSLALLRKQAKKELLYPGATRFATNIIMLTRLVELRDDLEQIVEHATWQGHMPPAKGKAAREAEKVEKAMTKASRSGRVHIPTSKITQLAALAMEQAEEARARGPSSKAKLEMQAKEVRNLIKDDDVWDAIEKVVDVCNPIMVLLRFMDGANVGLGKVYRMCWMLQVWAKAITGDQDSIAVHDEHMKSIRSAQQGGASSSGAVAEPEEIFIPQLAYDDAAELLQHISARWKMLHTPAHAAAYCLDPEYHRSLKTMDVDDELMEGLYSILQQLSVGNEQHDKARNQWTQYQLGHGPFSLSNAQMW
eukprot:183358-Chlamydomonas_euryale.AAC.1